MTRRSFFQVSAGGAITPTQFEPRSMLHVVEHPVARAKFPAIDVHTHLFGLGRKVAAESSQERAELQQIAQWMDECNLATLINLTGGHSETIPGIRKAMVHFGDRFGRGEEPTLSRANQPGDALWQAVEPAKCTCGSVISLKALENTGLYRVALGTLA